jgi:Holliday junction resolvasome RuvABC endonuclease subunit
MTKFTILALDLGTTTGWAIRTRDNGITSGTQSFKPQRFEGGGMRFLRFKRWLTEVKQSVDGINVVYFEEVRNHAGVDAAHAYGGFMAHLTAWCEHHDIPYQGVPVGTIKKHATGKGNASKDDMIIAMRCKGHTPADDNEADALALLHWAIDTQEEST